MPMSSVSWDEHHIYSIIDHLEQHLGLISGNLRIEAASMPENAFSAEINQENKVLTIFSDPESPQEDMAINVVVGYIIVLSYDRENWENSTPDEENLLDFHAQVCDILSQFNESFSKSLDAHQPLLSRWRDAQADSISKRKLGSTKSASSGILEEVGHNLFGLKDKGKWSVN